MLHSAGVISMGDKPSMIYQGQSEMSSGIALICRGNVHVRSLLQILGGTLPFLIH